MMQKPPDLEGNFHLFADQRHGPVRSNYCPQHAIHENYQTSGHHHYLDGDCVNPGETARVAVWLITPDVYPRCLWDGREIQVLEGARHVGNLVVTKVLNPVLLVSPLAYKAVWIQPAGVE